MRHYIKDNTLWVDFSYKGVRCRESLRLKPTKPNIKYTENLLSEIENRIASHNFRYADYFPSSKKCQVFGERGTVSITFEKIARQWLDQAEKRLKAGIITQSTYNNYLNETSHFLEMFGDVYISSITKADIEDFISEYSIDRKPKTVNNALTTIGQVFEYAIDKEYIDKKPKIRRLKLTQPEIYPFTEEEMMKILSKIEGTTAHPIIATMFYTGMRTGEALAMKWENIDFEDWTYHITESFSKRKLSKPKTPGSVRYIDIPEPIQNIIKKQKAISMMRSEFIFINKQGRPFTSSKNIVESYWKPILEELKIDYRIPYHCRHTFAALSLKVGDEPEDIARQLGHTSLKMLYQHYARFMKNRKKKVSNFAKLVTNLARSENSNS